MRSFLLLFGLAAFALGAPHGAGAVTLDEACGTFASRLGAAEAEGDKQKAQTIYQKGSQRIAAKFSGATCANVKPPTP